MMNMNTISEVKTAPSTKAGLFNRISYYILLGTVSLLPIFFIPGFDIEISKSFLISIGVLLSFSFWMISRLLDGYFSIPKTPILYSAFATLVAIVLASFFSEVPTISFIGSGFDIGSAGNILVLFLGLFMASILFTGSKRKTTLYFFIIIGTIICALGR